MELPSDFMQIPDRVNLTDQVVSRHVREGRGDRPAVHHVDGSLTFGELDELTNRSGNALAELGIRRGDRFVTRLPNSISHLAILLGGMKLGAVPIPTTVQFRAVELQHVFDNSGAKLVITTGELADEVLKSEISPETVNVVFLEDDADRGPGLGELIDTQPAVLDAADTRPDDVAFTIYTSGSTGLPKGVEHGHRWVVGGLHPLVHVAMRFQPDDVVFMPQEFAWLYVLGVATLAPLYAGAQTVVYSGRFDPTAAVEHIERFGVTKFTTVPTVLRMIKAIPDLEKHYDLGTWTAVWSGGERLDDETREEVERRFEVTIYELIGQTEVWLYMANYPGIENKPGSLGKVLPGRIVALLDDDGAPIDAADEPGHLVLGQDDPALALGYRGQDDEWRSRFDDGWFHTGDIAMKDAEGYYYFVGRADEMIKSRGYRIAPEEVEKAILEHKSVLHAGVIGLPDEVQGQKVAAFVVVKDDVDGTTELADEIGRHVRSVIAPYKTPKVIHFVDALPTTPTGKIDHKALKEVASTLTR
ncbi:MAG: acyl-CoA synthetase [Acidimicrobiia bacterium]